MNVQQRVQRTYRVALTPFSIDGEPITVEVNLSYPLDAVGPANSDAAHAEAIERLRRLARQGRPTADGQHVAVHDIEAGDWDVACARQVLVTIELDEDGKPIRQSR